VLFVAAYSYASKKEAIPSQVINTIVDGESFQGISIYKVSAQTRYFSIREVAKLYNATLKWRPVSSQITMNLNSSKIDIKTNSTEVVFGKKSKKMSLPSRLIKNDIYISPEILTSKEFSDIAEADTRWNPASLMLNITHRANISAVRYFTRSADTQVLVQLDKPLPYTVSKTSSGIVLEILKGKVRRETINVNNGIIKDLQYGINRRAAVIKINLVQKPKRVKTSVLSNPDRISIDITHSKNIDISNLTGTAISSPEEEDVARNDDAKEKDLISPKDLIPPAEYGQAQLSEIMSIIENSEDNKDLEKVPVTKFESNDIIDDSYIIVDDMATVPKKHYKRKKIIILDAGHGGEDPGAIGPNGTKEKDINLGIVRELKSIFDNDGDYEIVLTRKDDTFIPLAERTNIANKHNADLFISVHCNANFDRNADGFEIYFLSEHATDSGATATANLENSVLALEGKPNKNRALLQNMLWSMVATEYMNESAELSGFIAAETPSRLKIPNRGVKQAGFYVLRGTQMPAVLVESAFLSNYAEEAKLGSRKFRVAIADAIYQGVIKYYARRAKEQSDK
jgi:N-acetylmuramoyl-L-alanine amidase